MLVDLGFGDARVLVYGTQHFQYLVGTEDGGDLDTMLMRAQTWIRRRPHNLICDLAFHRHECDITVPSGKSPRVRVAVWHFHKGWKPAHLARVRAWLLSFRVSVYVSIAYGNRKLTIDGFTQVCAIGVMTTGQKGRMCARVFVRTALLEGQG
jgi:hypothetical protein